ncbi:beta-ketoacyl synthase N-terminal-like domain-containing protein [Amycolatopsis sp. H20-H5]|uniref:beta-ketoacyl synthase N-terminal-like domain-containing protein n=1 Tax=Amycolatopsis sp. H20-H5 TaxID=3046309 RepID=UPI002DBBB31C|nr:beta-ketoacyl synthase N-terminal-like domain-containing protein [Amycolatopsis sp. H20-H5]MEC3977388.1 beta-ketoacyl synthase N-terminal-like domain-containing protein [Amycolatopsis sp. H20-H5]
MTATFAGSPHSVADMSIVDIVSCGVFSAAGRGLAPLAEALVCGTTALPADAVEPDWPPVEVRPLGGFDPGALLGRKGLSRLTRTDQLAMAVCADALVGPGPTDTKPAYTDPAHTGIVLGTATGSTAAIVDFFRDTLEQARPYMVNPAHFPGTLMNSAAGKTAIRQGLTGLNATVSGGAMASMNALRYARSMLIEGRARRLVAGGVEELSLLAAWAWHRGLGLATRSALAEGGAMFALDAPGGKGPVLGRLLAGESSFSDPAKGLPVVSTQLAACVRTALEHSGLAPGDVSVIVPGAGGRRGWAAVEERALRAVFTGAAVPRLHTHHVLGETYSAGTALNLAALLAGWRQPAAESRADERHVAVLTSVGFDGSVGCLVVAHPDFT